MNTFQLAALVSEEPPYITDSTKAIWKKAIAPIKDVDIKSVDKKFVRNYIKTETSMLAESTVKMRLGILSGIWNRAIDLDILDINPWQRAGKNLKAKDAQYPVRDFDFYYQYHKDPLFLLLWFHGFRLGEIAGIQSKDVVMDAKIPYFNLVHYEAPFRALKNDKSIRQVPIHPACYSFVGHQLYPFSIAKSPGRSWSDSFRLNLGLPKGESAHSLRHNFATRLRATNPNPAVEARILGHTFPNMTARYGSVLPEHMFEAICKIPDPR